MGSFTVISDVSKTIQEFIRKTCVPSPVQTPELIGICDPGEPAGYSVGIYLYDIEENIERRSQREIPITESTFRNAPSCLNLYYAIFTSLKSDPAIRAVDEQRILGRIYQKLTDNRIIEGDFLQGTLSENSESLNIALINLDFDEKLKLWSSFNIPPKTALFYKASPVFVESEKIRTVRRVIEADISVKRKDVNY